MSSQRGEGSGSFLSILAGIIILLAGAAAVFYAAYKVSYVSVDYGIHVGIVEELDWRNPVQMLKEHPEPAWHLLVRAAMSLFGLEAKRAAGLVSGGLCALAYLMAAHFLYRAVGKGAITARDTAVNLSVKASAVSSPGSGSGLSLAGTAFFTLILSLSAAIFVPWFNEKPYLGQGSPNPWHNPTTIMVRPIALLIFVLVMGECLRVQRGGFRKGQGLKIWKGILIAILLVLSNLSKPSFVQVFYPAIFLLMFLWLFVYRFRNFPLGMQLLVCCLPSVGLMGMQFLSAFYGTTNSDSAGVVIAPFKVAGLYTPNIAISTLLVLAFPLLLALCSIARRVFDWTDAFAWLMLLAGMAEKFLLAEGGSRFYHGNFSWGYIIGLYLLWFVSVRDYAAWYCVKRDGGATGIGSSGAAKFFGFLFFILCGILLLLHLISGIYYLYYLIVLGNGV